MEKKPSKIEDSSKSKYLSIVMRKKKSVYYCIILKNKEDKEVKKVNKRYSDFKSLHLNMKSEMKQKKIEKGISGVAI